MKNCLPALALPLLLNACAMAPPCERIEVVMEQQRRCDQMRRNMDNLKGRPQMHGAAMERYRQECLEFRYYRDDFSDEELKCLKEGEDQGLFQRRQEARREQD
ncbi:hypothetical protein [Gallaecimonas sp. GXIMD4217]|uniref:hypothetical protein n=1 Tax=Gallaecimonas sp. GXIMD4217 TaxID=3131927 RepID=UPI00311AF3E8